MPLCGIAAWRFSSSCRLLLQFRPRRSQFFFRVCASRFGSVRFGYVAAPFVSSADAGAAATYCCCCCAFVVASRRIRRGWTAARRSTSACWSPARWACSCGAWASPPGSRSAPLRERARYGQHTIMEAARTHCMELPVAAVMRELACACGACGVAVSFDRFCVSACSLLRDFVPPLPASHICLSLCSNTRRLAWRRWRRCSSRRRRPASAF